MMKRIFSSLRGIISSGNELLTNSIDFIIHYYNVPQHETLVDYLCSSQQIFSDKNCGAWGETKNEKEFDDMAPLATSEVLYSMMPYHGEPLIDETISNGLRYLLITQNEDGGWEDYTRGTSIIDSTGCAVAVLSKGMELDFIDASENIKQGIEFLIDNQNQRGGWCARSGGASKIQYTYFALLGLVNARDIFPEFTERISTSIDKALSWIEINSKLHEDYGVGISSLDPISPVATALAVLCYSYADRMNQVPKSWINYLKSSQRDGGEWEQLSDEDLTAGTRRVYVFKTIPWAVESIFLSGRSLNDGVVQKSLLLLNNHKLSSGGYVKEIGDDVPVLWFSAMVLRMIEGVTNVIKKDIRFYLDEIKTDVEINRELAKEYRTNTHLENRIIYIFFSMTYILYLIFTLLTFSTGNRLMGKSISQVLYFICFGVIFSPLIYWLRKRRILDTMWEIIITAFLGGLYVFLIS